MTPFATDYAQQLLAYLQAWRQYLEQTTGTTTPAQHPPPAPCGMLPTPPAAPFVPPPMPSAAASIPMTTPPADYTQQLLAYLQAWRQYLEQAMGTAAQGHSYPSYPTTPPPAATAAAAASGQPDPATPPPAATTPAKPPRPTTSAPMCQTSETVLPQHIFVSQLYDPKRSEGETFSHSDSHYGLARSFPSEPAGEYQPTSAYPRAARAATSGAWEPVAAQSLHSGLAAPTPSATREETHRGQSGGAVSGDRPEEFELVRPFKDSSR